MKGLIIDEPGSSCLTELERPAAGKAELLLKIKYVGFCGSDLSTYLGKNPLVRYPRVPGHEISAEILESGTDVPPEFRPGTAVTVVPYTSCGKCPACRRGREYACEFNQTLGVQRDGAMKEYLAVPWQKILLAPALGGKELAMVEPLTVGFHAVRRGRVGAGDTVAVMGCGMIGSGAIVAAARTGAGVVAVDIDDHKLELARKLGAAYTVNSATGDLHGELQELTEGRGPDLVIEAVGNPGTYRAAVDEVAFTGRVVCIGYTSQEVSFETKLFVQKELDIMGSRNATADDFREVINYLLEGTFPLKEMVTRVVNPEEAPQALREWADDPAKVMKILVSMA